MKYVFLSILLLGAMNGLHSIPVEKSEIEPAKALKMAFDFYVKNSKGIYDHQYSGDAMVDNKEEVVFSYNDRISKNGGGIKITMKPFITASGVHFLVKYFKREKGSFFLFSRSIVKYRAGKDAKIQVVDGDKVYKLQIKATTLF